MDKVVTHTQTHRPEYYPTIKKSKILPLVKTQIDLEGIMLNQINQTERDKYNMISMWNPKN